MASTSRRAASTAQPLATFGGSVPRVATTPASASTARSRTADQAASGDHREQSASSRAGPMLVSVASAVSHASNGSPDELDAGEPDADETDGRGPNGNLACN